MRKKLTSVNKPIFDDNNYAIGTLIDVSEIDCDGSINLQFTFSIVGTKSTINSKVWTGTNVNFEKINYNGVEKYNKLTTILVKSGLLEISTNINSDYDIDFSEIIGRNFRFKMNKLEGKSLYVIELDTLEIIE